MIRKCIFRLSPYSLWDIIAAQGKPTNDEVATGKK
jgi:hypothetical protein